VAQAAGCPFAVGEKPTNAIALADLLAEGVRGLRD